MSESSRERWKPEVHPGGLLITEKYMRDMVNSLIRASRSATSSVSESPVNDGEMRRAAQEFYRGAAEVAPKSNDSMERGGDDIMDDSIKMMIERMERDSRERENRYHTDAQERENRYREEMKEQDRRLREEAKEREERILAAVNGSSKRIEDQLKEVKQEVNENVKHVQSLVRQNFWGNISTIVAVIGIAATICFTIWAALKGS
ncbi:hypothetical protein BK121_08965 [Paenibacillus odorifer]|uniref:hypothetical protein n=1 Tax=Paenibacillus odorifer TaxID=189426 RepID=UPI00096FDDD9|nr:hypothetical protein [Paenibacillus odorifer]OMC73029.1 hypothetical protein BK121_08965 [Paenibacillus odorifer]